MLHSQLTNTIIGSFFEVHRGRGYGFLESVSSNSMAVEIGLRGLEVRRETPVEVHWKGVRVGTYRVDMVVEDLVLVEVKTVEKLIDAHSRQLVNYLKATGI